MSDEKRPEDGSTPGLEETGAVVLGYNNDKGRWTVSDVLASDCVAPQSRTQRHSLHSPIHADLNTTQSVALFEPPAPGPLTMRRSHIETLDKSTYGQQAGTCQAAFQRLPSPCFRC